MLLGSFTARFSYGLLVISAPESADAHEDWDPVTTNIHAGPDSLYVGVRDTASGLVSVSCIENLEIETELPLRFSGRLFLPSARLKFYDPEDTIAMTVPVSNEAVMISIYSDKREESSELLVHVTNLQEG